MKYSAGIYRLIAIAALFVLPQTALADSSTSVNISDNGSNSQSDVNVQNSTGGNTICQNGNCTTTGGGSSHTTVCINGQCSTTEGNVDMQSPDGHEKVTVNNNSVSPSVIITTVPSPTATTSPTPTVEPSVTTPTEPTMTPDPTIMQMRNDLNNQVAKQFDEFKEHMKAQQGSISSFIKSEVQSLQDFFSHIF